VAVIHFLPGGEVRAIYTDAPPLRQLLPSAMPRRASRIEVIEEGKHRGKFHVDFSLLAAFTGQAEHAVCLAVPFESYREANDAEVAWLAQHYVKGVLRPCADQS
jgi:hypothetical protein